MNETHEEAIARIAELEEALRKIARWAENAEEGWYPGGIALDALEPEPEPKP